MTQIFTETGEKIPVTVLDTSDVVVSNILKEREELTHFELGVGKKKRVNKPDEGNYKALGFVPKFKYTFKNNKLVNEAEELEIGAHIRANTFEEGELVDVSGVSKGKGFQGVVKRYGFAGGPKTHGQSDKQRSPGSIGAGTTPGRVVKGKKMPGHMGARPKTVLNVKVVKVDEAENLLILKGAIPGNNGAFVLVEKSIKSR